MNAKNRPLIPLESIVAGSLSGTLEASVNQPLIYIKNCIQLNKPVRVNPLYWYRGYVANVGSLAPATVIQVTLSHLLLSHVFHKDMSRRNVVTSAFTAGAISGMITGPAESVIVNQQLHGNTILHTLRTIYTDAGLRGIFRGTPYVMFRDGSYTAGYIALAPMLGRHLHQLLREKMQWNLPWLLCNILSGIAVGSALSTLTHPIDTYKTVLQEDYSRKRHPNLLSVMRHVPWSKGFVPRISRICVGVCVLSISTTLLTDYLVVTNPFHVV
uniref:Citrate transport protein n=2 Tax=Lygus hesperus TaxID=30085 RepID=A0A146LB89_LYGHE